MSSVLKAASARHQIPQNHSGPWTVTEYATRYRLCRATIYNHLKSGKLGSILIGGARRILPEHDRAFVESLTRQEA